jgi:hypothetical protein
VNATATTVTARVLRPEAWPRLAGTELAPIVPGLNPQQAYVVVVEDDTGAIVGCWALLYLLHAEGVWIAEPHRKRGAVARRLFQATMQLARAFGETAVTTGSVSPEVERLLVRRLQAVPWPGTQYSFPTGGV